MPRHQAHEDVAAYEAEESFPDNGIYDDDEFIIISFDGEEII
jgi:hypothetical protein